MQCREHPFETPALQNIYQYFILLQHHINLNFRLRINEHCRRNISKSQSASPSSVTIIVTTMNLFKIRVPFIIHASCWANFHSSFQIIYFGFWKVTERQTQHYSLILFSWLLNLFEIRRRDNSILLVVGKFKSHLSSSGYLGLIL